jgi:hypothetical protein
LDVDFNVLTGVVDVSLLTRTLDVDFNSMNYRGGGLFIDSVFSPYIPSSTSALFRGGCGGRGYYQHFYDTSYATISLRQMSVT